jgi:uncharacterized protein (TIGR03084 family)
MREIVSHLLDECRSLAALCEELTPELWGRATDFYRWTPWDEIAHLAYFDETALQAVQDPATFLSRREILRGQRARGEEISSIARERFLQKDGKEVLDFWRLQFEFLCSALIEMDPKARLPWYGPEMSARSFATARLMETWAHGQDIRDMLGRNHWTSSGLRQIVHLGVNTYHWTFKNRGLLPPEPVPYVDLEAPDGTRWTWGAHSSTDYVMGSAYDFALLVTQRRHRSDTTLQWRGEGAERWTLIAQCFAGAPSTGPAAGVRRRNN